ncbi:DUF1559 domain-containing protein [Bremerella cremea]|uniref:Prepilin-type cleavage/methylation domain-containing protein n=1 Tax=Blastopirellula marina TaxID=124 RepID=A0A2S8FIP1_9BACT|nr:MULTISPECIES: DUF1559 domain-containing protein [Pirellulaceae]PQO32038.1 prepilin-type cleavage/methylation domain-containing protein [Blastopirellula marina]RCS45104.1 DUF1559 domain-containing protein [Bremerella cremea]
MTISHTKHDFKKRIARRSGYSLRMLFAAIFLIGVLLLPLVSAINQARENARQLDCSGKLKQLLLAVHNYHDTYRRFPSAMGGTGIGGNENRLSGLVVLSPYMESSSFYIQIVDPSTYNGINYPAMGPAPWDKNYPPWHARIWWLKCPSAPDSSSDFGPTNYAFCIGDIASDIHHLKTARGMFAPGLFTKRDECTDGSSNTLAMAEIGTASDRFVPGQIATQMPATILQNPSLCLKTLGTRQAYYRDGIRLHPQGRGYNWADGAAGPGLFNTILPPNSPSCAVGGNDAVDGFYSAGSFHPDIVNVAFLDGSVQSMNDSIDTGDLKQSPPRENDYAESSFPSPFGVWGALGSRAGGDDTDDE